MARVSVFAVMCAGGIALMLLPLVVPVAFGGGVAGRRSLLPAWAVVAGFYSIGLVFVIVTGRALVAEFRQRGLRTVLVRSRTFEPRLHETVEVAAIPANAQGVVRVCLREVRSGERVRFVGRVRLRGAPSSVLGELVHDEGAPVGECGGVLPGTHAGVLEWVTVEYESDRADAGPAVADVEVRLLGRGQRSER